MTTLNPTTTNVPAPSSPPGPARACWLFASRSLLKIKHVPEQLIDALGMPIVTTVLFTYLFGGALASSPTEYLQYLLPGIMVMSVLMLTMYTGMGISKDLSTGAFDRFRTMDVWRPAPLVGQLVSDGLRYLLTAIVITLVGIVLGYRPGGGITGVLAAIAVVVLFAFSVSWIWLLLGIQMRNEKSVMGASMGLILPLAFVSNIFLDPATMPGWLQAIVKVNPVTHTVTAARDLSSGAGVTTDFWIALASCAAIVLVTAPLSVRAYNRR